MKKFVINWKLPYDPNVAMFSSSYYAQPCQSPEYVTLGNGTCCTWQLTLSKPAGSYHLLQFTLKLLYKDGGKPSVAYASARLEIMNNDDHSKTLHQTAIGKDLAPMTPFMTCTFRINFDVNNGYLSRDQNRHVFIRCLLELPNEEDIDGRSKEQPMKESVAVDLGNLPNVVLRLFRNAIASPKDKPANQFSDVILRSSDERDFHVHGCFLIEQSPVFKKLLESAEFLDQPSRTISLPDVNGETLLEVLRYVYTETVSDMLIPLAPIMLDVIERYTLPEKFKQHCVNSISTNLHIQNAVEMLLLADRRRLHELKKKIIEFVVENLYEIRQQTIWRDFIRDHPSLVDQVFECITKNNHFQVNNIGFIDSI